jgi:ATP-binding protein involved in chromosome partitioning
LQKWLLVDDIKVLTKREAETAIKAARLPGVKHKIVVMSGKGGVGKSTVAVNLAMALVKQGRTVGVLDADLHGPSVPKMLGCPDAQLHVVGEKILPAEPVPRLKVVSVAYLATEKDAPVVWRGPVKMGALKQFIEEVAWGKLDYLIIDLPPGTGDEPLSIAQLIPDPDGAIIVTTPQDVALISVKKSVRFAKMLNLKVIGLVDNMNGYICPKCGEPADLFGGDLALDMAKEYGIPYLGKVPLHAAVAHGGEDGVPFVLSSGPATEAFEDIVANVIDVVEKA